MRPARYSVRSCNQAPDPLRVLRALWMLDFEAVAVERTFAMFEKATRDVPDDDRVWLGLANLARRAGRLDEAAERLRKCRDTRPEDPAVWRSWLAWASRPTASRRPASPCHISPPSGFTEGEVQELRAWFAASADDRQGERRELERLVECEPGFPRCARTPRRTERAGRPDRSGRRSPSQEGRSRRGPGTLSSALRGRCRSPAHSGPARWPSSRKRSAGASRQEAGGRCDSAPIPAMTKPERP